MRGTVGVHLETAGGVVGTVHVGFKCGGTRVARRSICAKLWGREKTMGERQRLPKVCRDDNRWTRLGSNRWRG